MTDGGTDWEARYSVSNDGAVLRAIEGEVRHSHPIYGDFAISRWLQEDDIERYKRFGGDRFGTPTSARSSRSWTVSTPTTDRGAGNASTNLPAPRAMGEPLLPRRRARPTRRIRVAVPVRVPAFRRVSRVLSTLARLEPVARSRSADASLARVLAPRLRRVRGDGEDRRRHGGGERGDAQARGQHEHRRRDHQQRRHLGHVGHLGGGGVSQAAAPAQSGRAGGGEVRRARGGDGHVVPFHRGVQGWHVDAKAILSPNGIATRSSRSTTSGIFEDEGESF